MARQSPDYCPSRTAGTEYAARQGFTYSPTTASTRKLILITGRNSHLRDGEMADLSEQRPTTSARADAVASQSRASSSAIFVANSSSERMSRWF